MKKYTVLLLSTLLFNYSFAQEIKKPTDGKDQKFILNNSICIITKKEQDSAKEFIISTKDDQLIEQYKLPLAILQLRIINGAKFNEIQCALKYFNERYNEKSRYNYNDDQDNFVSDYLSILEKLRTDPKTKADFEKNILNSSDFSFYYKVISKNTNAYQALEPKIAQKIFVSNITSKSGGNINKSDFQMLFKLFYTQNITPPKDVINYIKNQTNSYGHLNATLLEVFLENANDSAYSDFKPYFENFSQKNFSNFSNFDILNSIQVKNIFTTKYLPDPFKCNFANEIVSKNATRLSPNSIEELKNLNIKCLNDSLADAAKFITPPGQCPQILFDKNTPRSQLISKISSDFSKSWLSCRKKCNKGDKCTTTTDEYGLLTFINQKFEKDIEIYKEIQSQTSRPGTLPLKYNYKAIGICNDKGLCAEKTTSCTNSDIISKINEELKTAKYQSCNVDDDCYILNTNLLECSQFASNINPFPGMGMNNMVMVNGAIVASPASPEKKNKNVWLSYQLNFLTRRIQSLSEACGNPVNDFGGNCQPNQNTTVKCQKNQCVILK